MVAFFKRLLSYKMIMITYYTQTPVNCISHKGRKIAAMQILQTSYH